MDIKLIVGNNNVFFIKAFLHLLEKIEADGPVIASFAPYQVMGVIYSQYSIISKGPERK